MLTFPGKEESQVQQSRHVSLFAGVGGFDVAFARAGWRTTLFCERDPYAAAVLAQRFAGARIADDVETLDRLPPCEVVTGGFPCQDLSQAGRTAGIKGANSRLVDEVFRLVDAMRKAPRWIVLENVPFMLTLHAGAGMSVLVDHCEARGLRWAYRVMDARAFGLPQRRRRVVFVASRTQDPASRLLGADASEPESGARVDAAHGFYWTEGNRGLGLEADCTPPLKGSSGLGIPSPPAIWFPRSGRVVTPTLEACERLQGFLSGWTEAAGDLEGGERQRWRLVGNAVPVAMSEWLARRLKAQNVSKRSWMSKELEADDRWPVAAHGDGHGARFAADVSEWPVRWKRQTLAQFVGGAHEPLSARAAKGIRDRLLASSLRYPDALIDALDLCLLPSERCGARRTVASPRRSI